MTSNGGGASVVQQAQPVQYSMRRSRRSWSLSESDTSASLTRVDEEEMFFFDDDDDLKSNRKNTPSKMRIQDLEDAFSNDSSEFSDFSKTMTKKPDLFHRRLLFYSDQFRSQSPSASELASSCDSEQSVSMSIEGLRDHLQSCFTCGVVWRENQTSLDCLECDGYALNRPCPDCDGNCPAVWTRDLTTSHQTRKAKWIGKCGQSPTDEDSSSPVEYTRA